MEGKPVNEQHISHYLFEAISARMERTIRRLWIALIIAFIAIFITNALWLYAWTSYDYVTTETAYTQDSQGTNIIGDGNYVNAKELSPWSNLDNQTQDPKEEERVQ